MPRGYLKHRDKAVGRKSARGGNSRRPEFHRTPAWKKRFHEHYLRDERTQVYIDEEIDLGYEAVFYEKDHFDDMEEHWVGCEITEEHEDSVHGEPACHTAVVKSEEGSLVQDERETCVEQSDDAAESFLVRDEAESVFSLYGGHDLRSRCAEGTTDNSYSFCNAMEDSIGFSYVHKMKESQDDESSDSTIWDFVASFIGHDDETSFGLESITAFNEEWEGKDADSISCVTGAPYSDSPVVNHKALLHVPAQCAICLENKPNVLRIMHKCNHPSACMECLRTHYVEYGLQDASNFPLDCFWPGCSRKLREVQFRQLARDKQEMDLYYQRARVARDIRREAKREELKRLRAEEFRKRCIKNFKVYQCCSVCDTTQAVYPAQQDKFDCKLCLEERPVDVVSLDDIKSIVSALGECLVYCPACGRLIAKEGGCDDMSCLCGHQFSFESAQAPLRRYKN